MVIARSRGVELTDNAVADPRPGVTAAVTVMSDVEAGEAGVRIVDLEAALAPGSVPVDDERAR